jgi:hypothetical protein
MGDASDMVIDQPDQVTKPNRTFIHHDDQISISAYSLHPESEEKYAALLITENNERIKMSSNSIHHFENLPNMVTIITKTNDKILVQRSIVDHYTTLKTLLDDSQSNTIVSENISTRIMNIVIEFTKLYEKNIQVQHENWKWNFFDKYDEYIVHLVFASDYLDFGYFFDACTTRSAHLFETKTPTYIKKRLISRTNLHLTKRLK